MTTRFPITRSRISPGALLLALLAGCSKPEGPRAPESRPSPPAATLHFGGFSVTREVLSRQVLPQFAAHWRRLHGREVRFVERYDGNGPLIDALTSGFPADVAVLALPDDIDRLVQADLLRPASGTDGTRGIVSRSLIVLAVRKGNPLGIRDWTDLTRPGVRILTPDPATSGGGKWNVVALYGAAFRGHAGVAASDRAAATQFVARVFANVVDRSRDASLSFRAFQGGLGDVAITYESEIMGGWLFGHDEARVIPHSTLLVENPALLLDQNADRHGVRDEAEELVRFLRSQQAQKHLAFHGLRPVDDVLAAEQTTRFPVPADLWAIADFGGWPVVQREILDSPGMVAAIAARK